MLLKNSFQRNENPNISKICYNLDALFYQVEETHKVLFYNNLLII